MTDIFVTHFPADAHPDAPVVVRRPHAFLMRVPAPSSVAGPRPATAAPALGTWQAGQCHHLPAAASAQVLLGWAGAADRPLAKFAEMLAGEGLVSVRGIQPVSYLFSPLELWRRRFALSLLAFLERQQLSPPRCDADPGALLCAPPRVFSA